LWVLVAVFAGGVIGTGCRLVLLEGLPVPAAILLGNLGGAFLLGFLFEKVRKRGDRLWAFAGPGLLGALTTFSALQLEAADAVRIGDWQYGVLYLVASIGLGVPLAALGRRLGRQAP
jgi:CrcB protein